MIETILLGVLRGILNIALAAVFVGILAVMFAVHPDLTTHSDLFTGCALVTVLCCPSIGKDD